MQLQLREIQSYNQISFQPYFCVAIKCFQILRIPVFVRNCNPYHKTMRNTLRAYAQPFHPRGCTYHM